MTMPVPAAPGFPFYTPELGFDMAAALGARARAWFAARGLTDASVRSLAAAARVFARWCRQACRTAMPAEPATVAAFTAALRAAGRRPATVRHHRCAIARWHEALGHANPCRGRALAVPDHAEALSTELVARLQDYVDVAGRAFAPATLRALRADLRVFAGWCRGHGLAWLPSSPETVQAFLREVGASRAPATVSRYLSSIATVHRAVEATNPCDHWRVRLERQAHAREHRVRQRQATPAGAGLVARALEALPEPVDERPIDARDRAVLLVGHDTLARSDEVAALRWEDVQPVDPEADPDARAGEGTVLIRRSKTDQAGQGAVAWLSRASMEALARWRTALADLRGVAVDDLTGRVFVSLRRRRPGLRLAPAAVAAALVRRVLRADPLGVGYSGHSLRVGGAQDLLAAGVDLPGLMWAGRWSTPRMPARYTERLAASRSAIARVRRAQRG